MPNAVPRASRLRRAPLVLGVVLGGWLLAASGVSAKTEAASLPLVLVRDVPLPGRAVRFDYQDVDPAKHQLFLTHMNDAQVIVVSTVDGAVLKVLPGIPTPRGVVVAADIRRVFVTSSPSSLVIIDGDSLRELGRVATGRGPDGVAWDGAQRIVGVSDQSDGALSLLSESGTGEVKQVPLGRETGNVVFDSARASFWITVVANAGPNALVSVDPSAARITAKIPLPGCAGAHGLRLHPDGKSAFVACEDNSRLARVELDGAHALSLTDSGADPDVLAVDAGLGWLYVAAESGDLRVFDLRKPGLSLLGREHPGAASHSVAVDPATHHLFFPLKAGPHGTPVLRVMRPTGTFSASRLDGP